jgi:hypothetical protein
MYRLIILIGLFTAPLAFGAGLDALGAMGGSAPKQEEQPAASNPKQEKSILEEPEATGSDEGEPVPGTMPIQVDTSAPEVPVEKQEKVKTSDDFICGENFASIVSSVTIMFKEMLGISNPFTKQLVGGGKSARLIGNPEVPTQSVQVALGGLRPAAVKMCKTKNGLLKIYGVGIKKVRIIKKYKVPVSFAVYVQKINDGQVQATATADYINPLTGKETHDKKQTVMNVESVR